jgi:hypothetical protein
MTDDNDHLYKDWFAGSAAEWAQTVTPAAFGTKLDRVVNPSTAACDCCGRDPMAHWLKCVFAMNFWWPHRAQHLLIKLGPSLICEAISELGPGSSSTTSGARSFRTPKMVG